MSIKVKRFRIWHYWKMRRLFGWRLTWAVFKHACLFRHRIMGGWEDGRLLGLGGVNLCWRGVGEAFLILTPEGQNHPFLVARAARRYMESMAVDLGLRRLQATVCAGNGVGHRLATFLGFREEAYLHAYGPAGESHYLFVRFYDAT